MYGNLKDFLVECKQSFSRSLYCPSSLEDKPHGLSSTSSSSSSSGANSSTAFSLAYSALQEKIPLCQQSSVLSASSEGTRSDLSSELYKKVPLLPSEVDSCSRCNCPGGDGVIGEAVASSSTSGDCSCCDQTSVSGKDGDGAEGGDTDNGFLEVETIRQFALQIAEGLRHLEGLNVSKYYALWKEKKCYREVFLASFSF